MNIIVAILLPLIAGAIGWFTNFLAVKMLFHPRYPVKIFGFTIQGVFPKRQAQVAERVGRMVADELLHLDEIFDKINSKGTLDNINSKLERKLDNYFDITLVEKYPMASKLLPKKGKERIKKEILAEVEHFAPNFINSQLKAIEANVDLEGMVANKVKNLSSEKLEALLWKILSDEMKFIEWVGALLGFIIGLVQVLITFFIL